MAQLTAAFHEPYHLLRGVPSLAEACQDAGVFSFFTFSAR